MKPHLTRIIATFVVCIGLISWAIIEVKNISLPKISFSSSVPTTTALIFSPIEDQTKIILKFSDLEYLTERCCSSIFSTVTAKASGEALELSGQAKYPYPGKFETQVSFAVEDSKLKSSIKRLKVGKIESPSFLNNSFAIPFQKIIDTEINEKYQIKNVKITADGLILELI